MFNPEAMANEQNQQAAEPTKRTVDFLYDINVKAVSLCYEETLLIRPFLPLAAARKRARAAQPKEPKPPKVPKEPKPPKVPKEPKPPKLPKAPKPPKDPKAPKAKPGPKPKKATDTAADGRQEKIDENFKKVKRKVDRFKGMSEEEVMKKTLPDLLDHNLDYVIVRFPSLSWKKR